MKLEVRGAVTRHPNDVSFQLAVAHERDRNDLAADVYIPRKGVMKKWACLGVSGSGKTYCATAMVEGFLETNAQVVVIDTMGNWWGLRVDADGKRPSAFQIPIFGGDHADLPLLPEHGEELARAAAQSQSSMILDISDFTEGEIKKFVIAFATTLLRAKKKSPSPILVVWEECQDIIPQNMMGEDARMVGAVQRLIKRGRNYGVGTLLISQRPAAVNKGCLNMCETLFAFRTPAPLDRKAIKEWVDGNGDPQRATELMKQLPQLQTGTALMYSVAYDRCELVTIGAKATFNASSEPDFDDTAAAKQLAPIDLTQLKRKLDEVVRAAEDTDVDKLKEKIAELEARGATVPSDKLERKLAESYAARDELVEQKLTIELRNSELTAAYHNVLYEYRELRGASERAHSELTRVLGRPEIKALEIGVTPAEPAPTRAAVAAAAPAPRAFGASGNLSPMERNFLTALAQFGACSKSRLRTITGYAASGPVSQTFARLLRNDWAHDQNGLLTISNAGRKALGAYVRLPTGRDLRAKLLGSSSNLSQMEKVLLENACKAHPSQISKAACRDPYAASGPVSQAFAKLVAYGYLLKHGGGFVKAWEGLFG